MTVPIPVATLTIGYIVGLAVGYAWGKGYLAPFPKYPELDKHPETKYVEPPVSKFLVEEPYNGPHFTCPNCGAPIGRRHGQWCVIND